MVTVYALAIVVLLLCSAFFSGAEMAVFAYDRTEARELARHGKGPLPHLYRNLHIFLPTVICLNLVVNMGINVLAAVFTDEHLGTAYLPLVGAIVTVATIAFGELLPKTVAVSRAKALAPVVALPLLALMTAARPLVTVLVWGGRAVQRRMPFKPVPVITADELRFAVDEALERKAISANEGLVLRSIMAFRQRPLREFMTPRTDIMFVQAQTPPEEVRRLARTWRFARLPVTRGRDIDSVIGCVHVKQVLMMPEPAIAPALKPVYFAPECMTAGNLFEVMRTRGLSLAIVVDEYGQVAGLVSMHDLLEELLGSEYPDEFTPETPWVTRRAPGGWVINAATPVATINQHLGLGLPEDRGRTLAGLLFQLLGHLPERGERFAWKGWEFEIQVVRRKRIAVVGLRKEAP
ncbi:MAG: HlyC/CorC family transporter [Planctomycetes bacterium]|nr:HlyC/CorC family transporter [Planctomycetota bacterium]